MKNDGGKGSAPRPYSVDSATFELNWNLIFGAQKPSRAVYDEESQQWDSNSESGQRASTAG